MPHSFQQTRVLTSQVGLPPDAPVGKLYSIGGLKFDMLFGETNFRLLVEEVIYVYIVTFQRLFVVVHADFFSVLS